MLGTGESFVALTQAATTALELAAARVRSGFDAPLAGQKDAQAVLKAPALKRALDGYPDLKKQIEALAPAFTEEQQAAKASESAMKTPLSESAAELAVLAKLLG